MQQDPSKSLSQLAGDLSPEITVTAGAAQLKAPPPVNLTTGAVIDGRYQIEASIGEGGSGSVFRAWDRALGEPVAIKILHPERAREKSWINRLAREVRVARAIRHPNVCRVFDLGHADGHWFVTMELATGGALRQLLRGVGESPAVRPLAERLSDARALCAGLAAIHAVGITHRDVTPQNVLRMKDGRLVLSDFGLAIENNDATTVHGGTPAYMPPEALMGGRSDQRSDVWQLGAILHEIMFGRKPEWHRGTDGTSMKWPLPSVAGAVEEEVARLCGDCLAHDPATRPPTAMAVAGRLAAAEVARPRNWVVRQGLRVRAAWRQHRVLRAALIAAVVAVGAARGVQALTRQPLCRSGDQRLAGVWDQRVKAQVRKAFLGTGQSFATDAFWSVSRLLEDYAQKWIGAYSEACEATHLRGEQSAEVLDLRMSCLQGRLDGLRSLTTVFVQANAGVVENAASAASQLGALDRCADVKLLRAVVPPPEDLGARERVESLRRRVADTRAALDAGRFAETARLTGPLVADARRLEYAPILAEALELQGRTALELRSMEEAETAWEEGFWVAEEARHDELKAELATHLVAITSVAGTRVKETDRWSHLSEAALRRIGGHERQYVWLNNDMGSALESRGRPAEGLTRYQQALAIGERALKPDDPDLISIHNNMSNVLNEMGRPEEALAHIDKAIEIGRRVLGGEHPMTALHNSNRCEILNQLKRWGEAHAACARATEIWRKQLPADHLFFSYAQTASGVSFLGEGKPAQAVAPLEHALRIRLEKEPSPGHIGEVQFLLARALWDSGGSHARARALAAEAQENYLKMSSMTKQQGEVTSWLASHSDAVAGRTQKGPAAARVSDAPRAGD